MNGMNTLFKGLWVAASAMLAMMANAQEQQEEPELQPQQWLHIYTSDSKDFYSMPMEEVGDITFNANIVTGRTTQFKAGDKLTLDLSRISSWYIGANVPKLYINTDDATITEIADKTTYLDADLRLEGFGVTDDVESRVKIRGRGNSTWNYPKKPYRLKFETKTKLHKGVKKSKNYCLLANFLDETMMKNLAACTALQLLEVPGAFHARPVDVYLNGSYKGSYMLTEKMGFNNGCIDLTNEEEARSVMFELDANFDEDNQFASTRYNLPVVFKDPDVPEDPETAKEWINKWTQDFLEFESAVADKKDLSTYIDYETLARYLIAFNICCNQEINHPKSVYLFKTEGGKYQFGPGWDFDWAFGYFQTYSAPSDRDAKALHDEAVKYFRNGNFSENNWYEYNGTYVIWTRGEVYVYEDGKLVTYPGSGAIAGPSYKAPLLATGSNYNHSGRIGGGGEFFLDMISSNSEFMKVYAEIWRDFYDNKLNDFWAAFDAYERRLRPSAASNGTIWGNGQNLTNDVSKLREWIKNRIEYINNPAVNYGLFNK